MGKKDVDIFLRWRDIVFEEGLNTEKRGYSTRKLFHAFLSEEMETLFLIDRYDTLSSLEKENAVKEIKEELADMLNYIGFLIARYRDSGREDENNGKVDLTLVNAILTKDSIHFRKDPHEFGVDFSKKSIHYHYRKFMKIIDRIHKHDKEIYGKNYFKEIYMSKLRNILQLSYELEKFVQNFDEEKLKESYQDRNPFYPAIDKLYALFANIFLLSKLVDEELKPSEVFLTAIRKIERRSKEYESGRRRL